jgi:hypothetical protein
MANQDPGVKRYTLTEPAIQVSIDAPAAEGEHKDTAVRRSSAVRYPRSAHNAESSISAIETGFKSAFKAVDLPESQSKIDNIGWYLYISWAMILNALYP